MDRHTLLVITVRIWRPPYSPALSTSFVDLVDIHILCLLTLHFNNHHRGARRFHSCQKPRNFHHLKNQAWSKLHSLPTCCHGRSSKHSWKRDFPNVNLPRSAKWVLMWPMTMCTQHIGGLLLQFLSLMCGSELGRKWQLPIRDTWVRLTNRGLLLSDKAARIAIIITYGWLIKWKTMQEDKESIRDLRDEPGKPPRRANTPE